MTHHEQEQEQRTVAPDGQDQSVQPDWRREFPIDVPEDDYVARREFTKFMGLTSLAFVVGQLWIAALSWFRKREHAAKPLAEKAIASIDELREVGAVKTFTYPEEQDSCIVVRVGTGKEVTALRAYEQKCTHLSCAVVPNPAKGCLDCPCHRGMFDLETGRPLAGPPRRPLPRIELKVIDGIVYATDVELRTV